jgi:hypothetical protein
MDPSFANWYAQHVLLALKEQETEELARVRFERLKRDEARSAKWGRYFTIHLSDALSFFLRVSFWTMIKTAWLVGFLFMLASGVTTLFIVFGPLLALTCPYRSVPELERLVCTATVIHIDQNSTLSGPMLHYINTWLYLAVDTLDQSHLFGTYCAAHKVLFGE